MDDVIKEYEDKLPAKIIEETIEKLGKVGSRKLREVFDRVLEEYNAAKVDAGESVGLVSAESIGEPGTQMCLAHDERVIIKYDDTIHIAKIGEFVDSVLDSGIYQLEKAKDYEFSDIDNVSVLALNDNEKLEWRKVSKLNRHKSPEKLIRIKTKSGRSITATDFHSFVIRKNNKIVSIAGKDLKTGDRLPAMKYLPENCIEAINVYEYVDLPSLDNFRVNRDYRPTKLIPAELKAELKLDWDFGWFIGAYLAEGNALLGQLCISNLDDNYIKNAKRFVNKIGLNYTEKYHHRGFAPSCDFIVNSSLLARFIRNICGTGSVNKKVPEFAFSAKEEFVSGLLRGYFDGDGNFSVSRRMIRVSSNSEELLDGIKLLLTRFRIFAFKSEDHKQHYLIIPYKYAPIFYKKINSDIEYKRNNLRKLAEMAHDCITKNYQDYTDMMGGFDNILVEISRRLGLPSRYVNSATKRQKIGRTALLRHILTFEKESKKKDVDISFEFGILKRMLYSDVVWDEIEKIEYVKASHKYVYDLTVPGLHTFTTFEGIVTHNTLNTFHFAGVAEMNITMGLPRIIEILDGRKELSTPMMEIYLKKPYNQGKNIKENAMLIKETKFGDLVQEFQINIAESSIEVRLDQKKMDALGISKARLMHLLSKNIKGVNIKEYKESKNMLTLKPRGKVEELNDIYRLKEKIKDIYLMGIKGIELVLPVKQADEFVIRTKGSNLKDVLDLDFVDETKTTTNDVFEIANVLGIEAARQGIINEVLNVIEAQGLNVDLRHIMLVADTMCVTGEIKGITRYGVVSEKASVLARASFETPIKHIINASLVGEIDNLNSVVENVMLNQPVPIGTGLPELRVKQKK